MSFDTRLQAPWDYHAVRRPQCPRRRGNRPLHAAEPSSGVIYFLNTVEREVPAGKDSHAIMDNFGTHEHRKSELGSVATRNGRFTSRQRPPPGSMPLKASPQSSQDAVCGAASSPVLSTFRPPSTVTLEDATPTPNPSSGPRPPLKSSTSSPDWLHPLSDAVH